MGGCSHVHSSHEDQQISYSFSLCHLGVPDNRVILCCHMLQLHKTNNLCTNYKDHKEAGEHKNCNISFTCNQHKGGNRPSVETPFHTIPAGFVYLSARAGNVTAGEGDFYELWKCSRTWSWSVSDSGPVMALVQQSTYVSLTLLQWNTSVFCGASVAELHLGSNTMIVLIFQGMWSVWNVY